MAEKNIKKVTKKLSTKGKGYAQKQLLPKKAFLTKSLLY